MADKVEEVGLAVQRVLSRPESPPKQATFFFWTAVGADIQLDLCHSDLPDLRASIQRGKEAGDGAPQLVQAHVFERIVLSPESAVRLSETTEKIVEYLRETGIFPEGKKNA